MSRRRAARVYPMPTDTPTPEQVERYHALFRQILAGVPLAAALVGQVDPEALAGAIGDEWATDEPVVHALLTWVGRVLDARQP